MTSPSISARLDARRFLGIALLVAIVVAPLVFFGREAIDRDAWNDHVFVPRFLRALGRSVLQSLATAVGTFAIGGGLGVVFSTTRVRGARLFDLLFGAAAILPPMIVTSGWMLAASGDAGILGRFVRGNFGAIAGSIAVFSPIVMWSTRAAIRRFGVAAIEAALVAHGRIGAIKIAARAAWPAALGTALLTGALTIGDSTSGDLVGIHGAASEILASLAARYDRTAAAAQCLFLAAITVILSRPALHSLSATLSRGASALEARAMSEFRAQRSIVADVAALAIVVLFWFMPMVGLARVFLASAPRGDHLASAVATFPETAKIGAGAAILATLIGAAFAITAGRSRRSRLFLTTLGLAMIALPPAAYAFGTVAMTSSLPRSMVRGLAEGPWIFALAARLWPCAFFFVARAISDEPESRAEAATFGRGGRGRYFFRVLFPAIAPALGASIILAALLGAADIVTAILLSPPGKATAPQRLFTIMANAPDAVVATYLLSAVTFAAIASGILMVLVKAGGRRAKKEAP